MNQRFWSFVLWELRGWWMILTRWHWSKSSARKVQWDCLQLWKWRRFTLPIRLYRSISRCYEQGIAAGDLELAEREGRWAIDELTIWGYQSHPMDPSFLKWKPQTCGCLIMEHHHPVTDPTAPCTPAEFILALIDTDYRAIQRVACPAHRGLDLLTHYMTVLEESQLKNAALLAVFDAAPEDCKGYFVQMAWINPGGARLTYPVRVMANEIVNGTAYGFDVETWYAPNVAPTWAFDNARRLVVTLNPDVDWSQLIRMHDALVTQFGDRLRIVAGDQVLVHG